MPSYPRLLNALKMNAVFSTLSAAVLFGAADWIAAQLGLLDTTPVYLIAAVLVLFALQLWNIVRTRRIRHWEITTIVIADLSWVAASLLLVAFFYRSLTVTGLVLVDIVAFVVLFFAILQIRGLRRGD